MRLLIVEDEKGINEMLRLGFEEQGFAVDSALDGEKGLDLIFTYEYDVIILDINLPLMNGIEIAQELRKQKMTTPILMLTARDTIHDKLLGFDVGADDYLVKPFDFRELLSRVVALNRRQYNVLSDNIIVGPLEINAKSRMATFHGMPVSLTKKEFNILYFLASSHPNIVPLETIIEHCFDEYADPFSNSVRVHISNLKRKLRQAVGYEIIDNIKASGYFIHIQDEKVK